MTIVLLTWRDIRNPEAGGSELLFHEMAKRWVRAGHKVFWLCPMFVGARRNETVDGVRIVRKGRRDFLYFVGGLLFHREIKEGDIIIDIENGLPFFTPLFSRRPKLLHINHVHKDVWAKEAPFPISLIGFILENKIVPLLYRKVPVVTISDSSAEEIVKEGLSKVKPVVVNPGVTIRGGRSVEKTLGPSVLFLNRVKKYKGIDTLLFAIERLLEEGLAPTVFVAGDGDYLEKARRYAEERKLKNVMFLGFVSEEEKIELLQKTWVFVNPSFKEGWGIVNIEASQFGTPVIGSDVSGIKDSVVDGKTGLLFEYGNHVELANKIKYLLLNKDELGRMGAEGRRWAARFSWEEKSREYMDILIGIYKRAGRGGSYGV
jgi:glycosyltransferase involved in cell wall biosynthesis